MDLLINGKRVRLHPILVSDNGEPWKGIVKPEKKGGANTDPDFWSFHDQESACDIIEMIKTVFGKQSVDKAGKEAFDVWLAIGKTMDLEDSKVLDSLVCRGAFFGSEKQDNRLSLWPERYERRGVKNDSSLDKQWPVILVVEDNVLKIDEENHSEKEAPSQADDTSHGGDHKQEKSLLETWKDRFDPRHQFFDSSIWYRMISLEGDDFKGRFEKLLEEFVQNNKNKLYDTISAIESLELQQRLFLNSYLVDEEEGHAQAVVPFRFHSETMMKKRAREIEEEIAPYNWGCVLIDDFAYTPMKCKNKCPDAISKRKLIHEIVNQKSQDSAGNEGTTDDGILTILNNGDPSPPDENENWTRKGKELIKKHSYADILIVDYLLGKDENDQLQFGADLINNIMEEDELKDAKPFKKHWIFPIAVFSNAFASHLGEVGENNIQSQLTLAKGADPVTTPQLFKYQWFTFLKAQKEALEAIPVKILAKILNESSAKNHENHREVLARSFIDIISPMASFDLLEKAKEDGSLFAKSYLNEIDPDGEIKRLGIHIQNIAYFIGYGSVQDTGKIRQELWRLKDFLNRLDSGNQDLKKMREHGIDWIKSIEAYVEELTPTS